MDQKRHWRIVKKERIQLTVPHLSHSNLGVAQLIDAVTLTLEPVDGNPVAYLPGQYLPIIRTINGREERRAYSFSSCPGLDAHPAITIKRIPNGLFSTWLVEESRAGDRLLSSAPAGRFVLPEQAPGHLLYLAAGSGITPVLSQLKFLLELGNFAKTPVSLFYANRDSAHTIFKKQIDQWIRQFPERFSCTYFLSREKAVPNALNRHLGNALFERMVLERFGGVLNRKIRETTQVYLCAPLAMMRMAQMTLSVLDFPKENVHQETFVPETRHQPQQIDTAKTYRIVVENQADSTRFEFDIFGGETILAGALRQGIALPYTCKTGVCLSCLARCVQGVVDVRFVEQTRREGPGALINTCIGYPVTDVVMMRFE